MARAPTKTERIAREKLFRHLWEERQDTLTSELRARIPEAWHTLEMDMDLDEEKVKITLYLDASVAKFYRAMGKGYQGRINRILSTWAQMKIGGFLEAETFFRKRLSEIVEADRNGA